MIFKHKGLKEFIFIKKKTKTNITNTYSMDETYI